MTYSALNFSRNADLASPARAAAADASPLGARLDPARNAQPRRIGLGRQGESHLDVMAKDIQALQGAPARGAGAAIIEICATLLTPSLPKSTSGMERPIWNALQPLSVYFSPPPPTPLCTGS